MSTVISCCHTMTGDGFVPAFHKMVIWDWYDGPETGMFVCDICQAEFYFFMVDWSDDHNTRVFAIQELDRGSIHFLVDLVEEQPKWPLWMPRKLKFPSDSDAHWIEHLDSLVLKNRKSASKVVAWDNRRHVPLVMADISDDSMHHVQQLLESEEAVSSYDWLTHLSLPRQKKRGSTGLA